MTSSLAYDLRALANLIDDGFIPADALGAANFYIHLDTAEQMRTTRRTIAAALDRLDERWTLDRAYGYIALPALRGRVTVTLFRAGLTCETVQVGTRVEQQPDPVALAALAAVPLVDVEVPVTVRRCPDPLRDDEVAA